MTFKLPCIVRELQLPAPKGKRSLEKEGRLECHETSLGQQKLPGLLAVGLPWEGGLLARAKAAERKGHSQRSVKGTKGGGGGEKRACNKPATLPPPPPPALLSFFSFSGCLSRRRRGFERSRRRPLFPSCFWASQRSLPPFFSSLFEPTQSPRREEPRRGSFRSSVTRGRT